MNDRNNIVNGEYIVAVQHGQVVAVAPDWMDRYEAFNREAPALSLANALGLKIAPTWPDDETGPRPLTFSYDEARALADAIGGRCINA